MSSDDLVLRRQMDVADQLLAEMAADEGDFITKMALTAAMQARELARTKQLAEQNARRLTKVEADVNQLVFSNDNYCTVIGFCRLIGRRNVSRDEAADIGRRLRRLAREEGFDDASREVFDPLYGTVNAWNIDLLNLFFDTCVPRPYAGGSVR